MRKRPPLPRRILITGLLVSGTLHLLAVVCGLGPWTLELPTHGASQLLAVEAGYQPLRSQSAEVVIESNSRTMAADQVTGELVVRQVKTLVDRINEVPIDGNLDRLDGAVTDLDRVSSQDSLDDLAERFQEWFGLEGREVEPAEQVKDGPFDYETAQLHDVDREGTDPYEYWAVLLDAEGRTTRIDLTAGEGETLYRLMQKIKANPLLEKIYRKIAMPLLDQFIDAANAAESVTKGQTVE